MDIIDTNEVMAITGFSYRFLQMSINGELKTREELPHYRVIGKRIHASSKWIDLEPKFCKAKVVYDRTEVLKWFNENYLNN